MNMEVNDNTFMIGIRRCGISPHCITPMYKVTMYEQSKDAVNPHCAFWYIDRIMI